MVMVALSAVMTMTVSAQISPRQAFTSAPRSVFPQLDEYGKLYMVEYFLNGSSTPTRNRLGGSGAVTALDSIGISFTTSSVAEHSIYPLKVGPDSLFMVISTVRTPLPDSRITFYNTDWSPADSAPALNPSFSDWLTPEGLASLPDVSNLLPFILASASFDPASRSVTFIHTMRGYLLPDDFARVEPFIKSSLTIPVP